MCFFLVISWLAKLPMNWLDLTSASFEAKIPWLISLDFRWSCYFYLQFNQGTIGWTKLSNWFQPTEDFSSVLSRRWWCSPGGVGVVDTRWRWPHGYQMVSDRYRQTVAISAKFQISQKQGKFDLNAITTWPRRPLLESASNWNIAQYSTKFH